jgi:hypothetical protein
MMFSGATSWPMRGLLIPVAAIFLAGMVSGSLLSGWVIWEMGVDTGKILATEGGKS